MSFLLNLMGSSLIPAGSTPQAGSLEDGAHRRSTKEMVGLKSCCYFFDLKMGCKLIAFFEALLGLMQIYQCYNLINQPEAVSIGTTTESEFVTRAIEDDSMDPHASHSSSGNHYFTMALETVAVMKSIMLIIGAKTRDDRNDCDYDYDGYNDDDYGYGSVRVPLRLRLRLICRTDHSYERRRKTETATRVSNASECKHVTDSERVLHGTFINSSGLVQQRSGDATHAPALSSSLEPLNSCFAHGL
ncbi:GL20042 [Drosophila persimilis]|uniref:GL20042 n=1 Tax=Drosophila persimilis TaxID=7234 RepID=B4H8D7_DROPE|nr:GL20042 [Drosophila persimilis]